MATSENKSDPKNDGGKIPHFLTEEQLTSLIEQSVKASIQTAETVVNARLDAEIPNIKSHFRAEAQAAAFTALARHKKLVNMKNVGINVGTSLGVFIAGTLAMAGIDRYRNRNRQGQRG